ncbi:MAG: type II toxin-antitoxin system PrlF family antitoxin [Gammaproteobacteria bacterium]|nr:type II toxin-antitoxin system PrlF family antitoxin [Gammaproteobacteria bacterium]
MSALSLQVESTLTDRYQTTVPTSVRKTLRLNKRDRIQYIIQPDNNVLMVKAEQHDSDPVVEKYLSFLANDISNNPHHLKSISSELVERIQSLVSDVEIDLDAPLSDEDD